MEVVHNGRAIARRLVFCVMKCFGAGCGLPLRGQEGEMHEGRKAIAAIIGQRRRRRARRGGTHFVSHTSSSLVNLVVK